jgi:YspA, cpYpsA-related SLOG family
VAERGALRLMRVLGCGDRNWTDRTLIFTTLSRLYEAMGLPFVVIDGQARGADKIVAEWAEMMRKRGVEHEMYPARWSEFGRAAGPIRNQQMLDEGQPDLVVAFHAAITESRGTKDMVARAEKAGVQVWLIRGENALI